MSYYQRLNNQTIEVHGQPHTAFALERHASALADKLQCRNADWAFEPVMTPDGVFVIAVTGYDENGDASLLGFL